MPRNLPDILKNGPPLILDPARGSAVASLVLLSYDSLLVLDREISAVWRSRWSLSKAMYLFVRYHSIVALSWYLMQAVGDTPFRLNYRPPHQPDPPTLKGGPNSCLENHEFSLASRWYIGLTENLTMLIGEGIILLRLNALYGWSRDLVLITLFLFFCEATVGLGTTIATLLGGSRKLAGSSRVLDCRPGSANLSDVNMGMWIVSLIVACAYLYLLLRKASQFSRVALQEERFPLLSFLWSSTRLAPTLHLCCRDGAIYFLSITTVILLNLVFSVLQSDYSPAGTPWLISVYTIASTRIFLNLKEGPRCHDDIDIRISTNAREDSEGARSEAQFATRSALSSTI